MASCRSGPVILVGCDGADEYIKGKRDFQQKIPVKVELVTPENVSKYGDYGKK